MKFVQKEEWNQKDRCALGKTPLHIALVYNEPSEDFNDFFFQLWDKSDSDARKAKYVEEPYIGENVLHIAIFKKFGLEIVQKIVEDAPELLGDQATGAFLKKKSYLRTSVINWESFHPALLLAQTKSIF